MNNGMEGLLASTYQDMNSISFFSYSKELISKNRLKLTKFYFIFLTLIHIHHAWFLSSLVHFTQTTNLYVFCFQKQASKHQYSYMGKTYILNSQRTNPASKLNNLMKVDNPASKLNNLTKVDNPWPHSSIYWCMVLLLSELLPEYASYRETYKRMMFRLQIGVHGGGSRRVVVKGNIKENLCCNLQGIPWLPARLA